MALRRPNRIHGMVFLGPGFNALRAGKGSLINYVTHAGDGEVGIGVALQKWPNKCYGLIKFVKYL